MGPLVVTDRRVPAPAGSKIALGVPARNTVRGLTMNLPVRQCFGRGPVGEDYRDNGYDMSV